MTDEAGRRSSLVAGAADVQAAWHRLYDRMLKLEFDGYTSVDPDLFPRVMVAVAETHRTQPPEGGQAFEIFRRLYDDALAEIDRAYPQRT